MIFTTADLLVSDADLAGLTSALSSQAQPDPIAPAIEEARAKVETICDPYDLPEAWLRKLIRALTLYEVYGRIGQQIPSHVKDGYVEAQKDLDDIREGKYSRLLKTGETPAHAPNEPAVEERHRRYTRRDQDGL